MIDTGALIAAERLTAADVTSAESWTSLFNSVGDQPAALPAIVYAELLVGVELASSPRRAAARRARIDVLAARVSIIEFDAEIARVWALLFAQVNRVGRTLPANDLAVAATAWYLEYSVLVAPDDEKHFRAIEGLKVETLRG